MNVETILREWLEREGAAGLIEPNGTCECELALMSDAPHMVCQPAYLQPDGTLGTEKP